MEEVGMRERILNSYSLALDYGLNLVTDLDRLEFWLADATRPVNVFRCPSPSEHAAHERGPLPQFQKAYQGA